MSVQACKHCSHDTAHNYFGKCSTPACNCRRYQSDPQAPAGVSEFKAKAPKTAPDGAALVIRNPETNGPIAVPNEVIAEAERPYQAYLAHRAGMDWDAIAEVYEWPSGLAVASAVKRYLNEGKAIWGEHTRTEAIAMELARYNRAQLAIWDGVEKGDIPSIMAFATISRLRISITHMDEREAGDMGNEPMPTTVVVGSAEYAAQLQAIAEGGAVLDSYSVVWDDSDPDSEPYLPSAATVS